MLPSCKRMPDWTNKLYYGANLPVLRDYVPDQSVYLDPPSTPTAESSEFATQNVKGCK